MPLWLSFDTITFIQAGIEPLGAIGNTHLVEYAIHQFIIKNPGIILRCEIAISLTPYFPAISQPVRNLFGGCLTTQTSIGLRNSGFTEIFLCNNIGSYLAPLPWNLHIIHFKHNFPVWISYN